MLGKTNKIIALFFSLSLLLMPGLIFAEGSYDFAENSGLEATQKEAGFGRTLFYSANSIDTGISSIITLFLSFVGLIFLIRTIISGISWMLAEGNETQISKAKDAIKHSAIGLAIVVLAYAIVILITSVLLEKTTNL